MSDEVKSTQPITLGAEIKEPVLNDNGKGEGFRQAMQGVWYCAVCLWCVNGCFLCVDNFSECC